MPIDYSVLKNELVNDPKGLGYAPFVAKGFDAGIPPLINALTGPGIGPVKVTTLTRDQFMLAVSPCLLSLPGLTDAVQRKWDRVVSFITASSTLDCDLDQIKLLLSDAVTDKVLTQPEVDAVGVRDGSRAEVLFGVGVNVSVNDVSYVLHGS